MGIGDVRSVDIGDCSNIYSVDVGSYGVPTVASTYVIDDETPTIIDTGTGATVDRIRRAVEGLGIEASTVGAICLTHVHLDHAGGAGRLAKTYPNADVYVHETGAPHLVDPGFLVDGTKRLCADAVWERHYRPPRPVPTDRIETVTDGDVIDVGSRGLRVSHTPGHTDSHVMYYSPGDDAVFAGEAAGVYVPSDRVLKATTPPPSFDLSQSLADIETLADYDPDAVLFSRFGPADATDWLPDLQQTLVEWVRRVATRRETVSNTAELVEQVLAETPVPTLWTDELVRTEINRNVRGALQYLRRQDGSAEVLDRDRAAVNR
jgi:glyoxylase-like metal-dependent hydrolase (beta-lactamase superfamily II)